jgi:hypothetical protein
MSRPIPRPIDVTQQFAPRPLPDLRQSCLEAHFARTRELLVWDSLAESSHPGVSLRTLPVQIFLDFAASAAREAAGWTFLPRLNPLRLKFDRNIP